MSTDALSGPDDCNCLAVRQAARHITQFYDQFLAPSGLRTTQFSILAKLRLLGPMTINALATNLVMDRTTLGRNILPLERDGLIAVEKGSRDRRSKVVQLTEAGAAGFRAAAKGWTQAQRPIRSGVWSQTNRGPARPPCRRRRDRPHRRCRRRRIIPDPGYATFSGPGTCECLLSEVAQWTLCAPTDLGCGRRRHPRRLGVIQHRNGTLLNFELTL